ncbi:hypothetical protein D1872_302890 [compost metagenome]
MTPAAISAALRRSSPPSLISTVGATGTVVSTVNVSPLAVAVLPAASVDVITGVYVLSVKAVVTGTLHAPVLASAVVV